MDDAAWKSHWLWLAAQLACWYDMSPGSAGRRFKTILDAKWQGVLNRNWNSDRTLVFAHIFLTKMMRIRRATEIRQRIIKRMDLSDRGIHTGMLGDAEAE